MIEVVCVCKRRFEVQDEHAGLSIKCPECRRLVLVPAFATGPVPDTIPPPGLFVPPGAHDPPPGPAPAPASPSLAGAAATAALPAPHDERLVAALESLAGIGRTIRTLVACILAVLVLVLLLALADRVR